MLNWVFKQSKKLQKEVKLLSNIFSNRLDDFVNSYDEKDVISYCQNRNTMSLQLFVIEKNRVADHSEIEKRAIERNRVISCSEMEEEMEGTNKDIFDINFLY